ncbi:3-deoxy-D-manno-octulosonic acid transferase [Mergibacter septicus]|uniref:lipid IV(A) 3-deoxy-D-manno-octulosonic acid transferase n=1 Tax=Mergibacter septicus TaxID=221402 RepID=UPI001C74D434|nr:lipid IV(A) 3-deoxy-D-manno-octulosonic acid transferase [Mergibacter septicus]QDJ13729.1 3-deoxy-D-manno-octulosonic acid transferase [Mergibacter septicus]
MLRCIYTLLLYLAQPLILLFFAYRSLKEQKYRSRLTERYGFYQNIPTAAKNGLILHAASVGEVMAAAPLIKALRQQYPTLPLTITTFTPTGSDRVKTIFGDQVNHCYLPFDLLGAVRRFLDQLQPQLFLIIETELWANLITALQQRQIPTLLINARLSARSTTRYAKIRSFMLSLWQGITHISAQDQISAERFLSLGYPPKQLSCSGNLKYDLHLDPALITASQRLKQQWLSNQTGFRPCWVVASTHSGEEQLILKAFQQILVNFPDLLLIIIPRHSERFAEVEQLIKSTSLHYVTRSSQQPPQTKTQVVLVDTMGEVPLFYGIADFAFIGGSLVPRGGHNPLEAAIWQLPIISGSHTFNFPEIFTALDQMEGVIRIKSDTTQAKQATTELITAVTLLLTSKAQRQRLGQANFSLLTQQRGAVQRTLNLIATYLPVKETTI